MKFKRHIFTVVSRVCHCEAKPHRLSLRGDFSPRSNLKTGSGQAPQSLFFALIIALFLFFPLYAFAETKEIISEGTYNMGDGETPSVAESRALLQAKRTALEQAGTYVESWTKVENLQLTKDEIQVLASGIMEVEILDKKRTVVREGEGIHFWVQIKAKVNPDKIEEMAKRVKEKSVVEDYKKIQEAYDKSQREIEELKKQLAGAKGEKEKKQVEAKITDKERLFEANQWFEKGYDYDINKEYDNAIEAYTKAIQLDPNYAEAHYNRGLSYSSKGQYDKAVEDYSRAIIINPNYTDAYYRRGRTYYSKVQYDKAIDDFNKVISIDPNYHDPMYIGIYLNRYNQGNSAIYYWCGMAYYHEGQYDQAINNFDKAISIGSTDAVLYNTRGMMYDLKGLHDKAIEDYSKSITLDPKHADAYYYNRGNASLKLGNIKKAISDFQKACDMGYENGCKNLQMALEKR